MSLDLDALLAAAVSAAHAGGEVVLDGFGTALGAVEKRPGDWVTKIDTASERVVRAVLEAAAPNLPVFGEEEGGERGEVGWFVDPLDGTANFVHSFPAVGVSIGLMAEGVPIVGVVYAPMLGDLYTARAGGGTFFNGAPVSVSDRPITQAMVATGFPFRAKAQRLDEYLPVFERSLRTFEDLRRAGAASLDLSWVAAGVFDGYFEQGLGPWDVAAGALLVREAGGVVTDWRGDDKAWFDSGDIVAAPPTVHAAILEVIAGHAV